MIFPELRAENRNRYRIVIFKKVVFSKINFSRPVGPELRYTIGTWIFKGLFVQGSGPHFFKIIFPDISVMKWVNSKIVNIRGF